MLYALPDHEVMDQLLPDIRSREISVDSAVEQINQNIGYVPIAFNPDGGGSIYFVNIGDTPLIEWKYIYTIERLAKENAISDMFITSMDVLDREDLNINGLVPDGFIFHVSRCGSTLFTKALSLSAKNITINQGGPLQEGFWKMITDDWRNMPEANEDNIRRFRNLVLLMTRKRQPQYIRSFVKFISWNIIYLEFVRAAFPETPLLYLYRDPAEVIAVVFQETTAVLRAKGQRQARMLTGLEPEKTAGMDNVEFLSHCYAHYFSTAQKYGADCGLHLINYAQLKNPASFEEIVRKGFNLALDEAELEKMLKQYHYYSKDDSYSTIYEGEKENLTEMLSDADKQNIADICYRGLTELNQSEYNIFPSA
jgi:hypothetical protein